MQIFLPIGEAKSRALKDQRSCMSFPLPNLLGYHEISVQSSPSNNRRTFVQLPAPIVRVVVLLTAARWSQSFSSFLPGSMA
ncbi:unnamed protein product [Victoria cruziana]